MAQAKPEEEGASGNEETPAIDGGARASASSHRTRELVAISKGTSHDLFRMSETGLARPLSQGPFGEASAPCAEATARPKRLE